MTQILFQKVMMARDYITKAGNKILADHQKKGGRLIELLALDDALKALPSEAMTEEEILNVLKKESAYFADPHYDLGVRAIHALRDAGVLLVRE